MSFWNSPRFRFYLRTVRYFRADRTRIALLLLLIGGSTLLGLLQVWPLAILVDSVITPERQPQWMTAMLPGPLAESRLTQIIGLAGLTLVFRLFQELMTMGRSLLAIRIGNNGSMRVRCDVFRKLQSLNMQFHRSQPQGDTIYRLTNDTNGFCTVLNVSIDVFVALLTLVVMLGIMLTRSFELTLIALAVAPLLMAINIRYGRVLKMHTLSAKQLDSQYTSTIQRSMATIGLVQAFGRETTEFSRFRSTVSDSVNAWFRFHWKFALYRLLVGAVFACGAAAIFGYGGYLVYRDQFLDPRPDGMTLGELMVFLTYLGMFYEPLCKITGAGASVQDGVASAERVFEVLDRDRVVADAPDAVTLPRQPRTLTLKHVGFEYQSGQPVLRDVDAWIEPGQMVAFVGSSGVGKSTLLNLLPRFADPTEGRLELDGIDLRKIRLRSLRRHVALVLQESVILPTTVAENISYGRPDSTEAEIRHAADLAGCTAFIDAMPDGYLTQITEGGQNLSGGQRQRIAIARALLTQAPIIVMDEPTSALDPHHEQLIIETLQSLKGQRTMVLVSHRLSTVVDCDRIFVMDEGRIVEQGTHAELLARHGLYYEMARHQLQLDEPRELIAA